MQGSTVSQYITTVSLYHSIAAHHRFAVFTLVQSCVECVVSVTDACPRNDRHVCWHCSTGGQCPGQTGTCATVCPHHRPPTLTSASSQVPGQPGYLLSAQLHCRHLPVETRRHWHCTALGGTTDHSSSTHLPLPPLMGQDKDTTLTLLATVEVSAHILHNTMAYLHIGLPGDD